ncbi:hypothetical protein XO12_01460 [Marinitoga sp. 1154]|uniref:transporter substrate-binding domain-containing protein n=1 Tax=Marinitoga sp. 1154 TaxID=1643335 RepID=UPI001586BFFB|nr:transporter substrate-binding domain-containing protein [Marinitoga sp. 1154]NUU98829.1 hypothetical protein [Marinitoga sp. 1154]
MSEIIESVFLISTVILTILMFFVKKYINAILIYAAFGTILSGIFFIFNAPDVAAVQMTIGSAFIIFVYIIAVKTRSKIKVGYIETPYLFEKQGKKLKGFEKELLDIFSENSFFEIDYIPIEKEKINDYIYKDEFDIIVGGIIIENKRFDKFLCSKEYLPTKLFKYDGVIDKEFECVILNRTKKQKIIDYLRLKEYFRNNSYLKTEEFISTGYVLIFSKNNKALRDDFNRFLKTFLKSKEYETIIRRNIG